LRTPLTGMGKVCRGERVDVLELAERQQQHQQEEQWRPVESQQNANVWLSFLVYIHIRLSDQRRRKWNVDTNLSRQ